MQVDGQTLPDGTSLDSDLCVVGAGPAGLTLAAEFVGSRTAVVLVESGSWRSEPATQLLNQGAVEGDPYTGLEITRHRQIGGTTALWNTPLAAEDGAKYAPLDPLDFRGEGGRTPWPIQFNDLEPFYRRAQGVAGLGRFDYECASWTLPPSPIPADHSTLASRVYQFGSADPFGRRLPRLIERAPNVTLCHGATAVRLRWRGRAVAGLDLTTTTGRRITINARRVVLAAGGIENTRILLVEADAKTLREESKWLGRGFMEHPRDYTLSLSSTAPAVHERLEFFDAHATQGIMVCGRIALREGAILNERLPNASVTLLPMGRPRRPVYWRIEALARRFGKSFRWPPGYGWSRLRASARRFEGFQLLINLEEFPNRENRLTLDASVDPLGIPRVRLHRRWQPDDAERLTRLRATVARGLDDLGLRPVVTGPLVPPDPNGHHHMGTTRMGDTSATAVTDSYGRVFGADNLFVVGGSLFPSAGYANPTLTIMALACRLADHLKSNA